MPNAYARGKMTELALATILGGKRIGNTGKKTPDVVTPDYVIEVKCVSVSPVRVLPGELVRILLPHGDAYDCCRLHDFMKGKFNRTNDVRRRRFMGCRWWTQPSEAIAMDAAGPGQYSGLSPLVIAHTLKDHHENSVVIRKINQTRRNTNGTQGRQNT